MPTVVFVTPQASKQVKLWLIIVLGLTIITGWQASQARAAQIPAEVGFRGPAYADNGISSPTAEKPQSKLWYAHGSWWGSLYNQNAHEFHIYRLDWQTQVWLDTGVAIDDRPDSLADILWDGTHLYVASGSEAGPGRLYRYSYSNNSYSLDASYPVTVTPHDMEAIVLAKDSQNILWITYTSGRKVYVAHSITSDADWVTPYVLPVGGEAEDLTNDDISAIVSYEGYIGVMWSNQAIGQMYFAAHKDGDPDNVWQDISAYVPSADDHINLKSLQVDAAGNVFAAVKTSFSANGEPQIVLLVCTTGVCTEAENWTYHVVFTIGDGNNKTRPIVLIDNTNREVYVVVARTGGGNIYYKKASIDAINFPPGTGTTFIEYGEADINNPTSTKQNLTSSTHLVVLASDDTYYYHNCITLTGSEECPDNSASLQFSVEAYSADEGAGTKTIEVTRSGSTDGTASVNYTTSDDTAVAGQDYLPASGTLTFAPGETSQSFTVTLLDDESVEGDETVLLSLSQPDGAVLGSPANATLTIVDDEPPPTLQFSHSQYTVDEAVDTAVISVTLSMASEQTVSVAYTTSDDTAVAGQDYLPASGTLTFAPGETSQSFTVTLLDDESVEGDETVLLSLSQPDGAVLGSPANATLTIVDDEPPPTLQFSHSQYTVDEAVDTAVISVTLSMASEKTVSVAYTTSDGTAVAGQDYLPASGTLTFAPGETSQSFTVTLLDDESVEGDETVLLSLSQPDGAVLGSPANATLTIVDDEPPPTLQFSHSQYTVDEAVDTAVISVTLSMASEKTVSVAYTTSDGTAVAGQDYLPASGTLTFAPGETSQSLSVTILDNTINEEDVSLQLHLHQPEHALLGTPDTATLTIVDNDPLPFIQFSTANFYVAEKAGTAVISVMLSAPSGKSISVAYAISNGTAVMGDDYLATNGTLTFAPGETTQSFTITILSDTVDEPDETINLTLSQPNNAILNPPLDQAVLTILENGFTVYLSSVHH